MQFLIFIVANFFYSRNNISEKKIVIATTEVAKMLYMLNKAIKNSTSVCLNQNRFYSLEYDYYCKSKNKYIDFMYRIFYGPFLFAKLVNESDVFIYLWSEGFFIDREFEFKYLNSIGKTIVCIFMGDDIRSPKLLLEFYKKHLLDGYVEYVAQIDKNYLSTDYENKKNKIADIASEYSKIIFSCSIDMPSYLKNYQYFFPFLYDKNDFNKNDDKFVDIKKIKILHAPSNPFVKGTPLVRATIKKLEIEGYNFEYIELQNMPNEMVLEHLKSSHIVLNQFYAFVPGVFGIEAMANHCAVLMSADPSIETGLPQDSKDAWMITKYWEVYDNLKYLLDNPEKIKYYADNGYEFAYKHYTYDAAGEYLNKVFKENGIIE